MPNTQPEAAKRNPLLELNEEELKEFPIGALVTCRFLGKDSRGTVIAQEPAPCAVLSPRFKVRWASHQFLAEGETDESDWMLASELRRIQE